MIKSPLVNRLKRRVESRGVDQARVSLVGLGISTLTLLMTIAGVLVAIIVSKADPPLIELQANSDNEGFFIPKAPQDVPLPPHASLVDGACNEWRTWYRQQGGFRADRSSLLYLYPPGRSRLSIVDTDIQLVSREKIAAATYVPCTFEGDGRPSTKGFVDFNTLDEGLKLKLSDGSVTSLGRGATFEAGTGESGVLDIFPVGDEPYIYSWTLSLKIVVDGKLSTRTMATKEHPIRSLVASDVAHLSYDSKARQWRRSNG